MISQISSKIAKKLYKPYLSSSRYLKTMSKYPGLGLPLRHFPQGDYGVYPMGIHGNFFGADSDMLPVREVAMMIIMDRLMDKPGWHKKVFDDEIAAKWCTEALDYPDASLWKQATGNKTPNHYSNQADGYDVTSHLKQLRGIMSQEAFDYCVKELQNKARYFEESKLIPTLDACATVVRSDNLVSVELQAELRTAFDKLKADQEASPDWHPNSNNMVQDLVHPSMYPLVYGRSKVLEEEIVGVYDAIEKFAGKGVVIGKDDYTPSHNDPYSYGVGGGSIPPNFWSDTYQWLPSNIKFQDDGRVKITSYINNLHPQKHTSIYCTIEKLIEVALPAWDQCLMLLTDYKKGVGAGRTSSRFSKPENPDDDNEENWDRTQAETSVKPSPREDHANADSGASVGIETESEESEDEDEAEERWRTLREPIQPQPDAFIENASFYAPKKSHRLSEKFRDSGLQIIVKMASIELTPEKPEFPVGGWHVEGQMNERICATFIYYLDCDNITSNTLSFRMQTSAYMNDEYQVGQDAYSWLEQVYGTTLSPGLDSPCLQNYGSVETKEGRILAFPNVFQHRVSPFRLVDPTKPGHRRFIVLWLVDPNIRIVSTANVPPQQLDWWAESIFSKSTESRAEAISKLPVGLTQSLMDKGVDLGSAEIGIGKLPQEISDMLREHFDSEGALLISEEEAREHREKLMDVRSAFHLDADEEWHNHSYSFCEH